MVLRQVGCDFETQYGYRPWLVESFVDTEHFLGTCYNAANWLAIGQTQGRSRQDRQHKVAKPVKTVFVYVYAIEAERLISGAPALEAMPGRTLSGARQGDWPTVKGYYRMVDKPDDSALNAAAILAPHRESTVRRMIGGSRNSGVWPKEVATPAR